MAAKPSATYWSVSQNDNDQYCRCEPCTELNTKYGGVPSGSILYFVNEVAKAFPDKIISTLAYWYSRTPPQNIQAQSNVNIMLCNIESRRQGPVFETDPAFSRDLISLGKAGRQHSYLGLQHPVLQFRQSISQPSHHKTQHQVLYGPPRKFALHAEQTAKSAVRWPG